MLLDILPPPVLADTTTDVMQAPWDKITLLGACIGVIVILWRLVGKLAGDKDGQNQKLVDFYKQRADEMVAMVKGYENVVNGNTVALGALTKQLELNNELLKDFIHEFEKRGD